MNALHPNCNILVCKVLLIGQSGQYLPLIGHFQQTSLLSRAQLDIEKVKAGGVSRTRHCPAVKRLEGLRAGLQKNYHKKLISTNEFLAGIGALSLKVMRRKKKTQWDESPPEQPAPYPSGCDSDDSLRYIYCQARAQLPTSGGGA